VLWTVPVVLLLAAAAGGQTASERDQSREIFNEIGGILRDLRDITGFKIHRSVPAEIISRDKVKAFLEKRMKETATPEEVRVEELTLKKFGLVPQDFDLAKNTVDLLTEQAAAFYDFNRKKTIHHRLDAVRDAGAGTGTRVGPCAGGSECQSG
jgi:hypothetical protein